MSIITGQQLSRYYDNYKERDITFNRQIIEVLKLLPSQVYLKCHGDQLPCVIYSCSMAGAKIVANLKAQALQQIRLANNVVSLRFAFGRSDKPDPLYFSVPGKVTNYTFYKGENPDLYFLSLDYTSKPSDDLIEMLGQLFDTYANYQRRKEERIELNPTNIKTMGIESKEGELLVDKQVRKCIIRDLSFSGAKVLLFGAKAEDKQKTVVLQFSAQKKGILIPGTIVRFEEVVGREDIGAFGIQFIEGKILVVNRITSKNTSGLIFIASSFLFR